MHEGTVLEPTRPRSLADRTALGFLARYSNDNTRDGYAIALRQFFGWCWGFGIDPLEAKRDEIELFARHLERIRHNQPATVAGKLTALAGFYKYACIDDIIAKDPMLHVNRPKVDDESTTNGFSRGEFYDCLTAALTHSPRAHALYCLGGLNGLRISEMLGINIEHIAFDKFQWTIRITRKGGGSQLVPMIPRTASAVSDCMEGRRSGPLFATETGARLRRQSAGRLVKRVARNAGITKRVSPHSLRHTFITLSLDAGAHPRDVQNSAGHKDPRQMRRYDRNKHNLARNSTHLIGPYVEGAA